MRKLLWIKIASTYDDGTFINEMNTISGSRLKLVQFNKFERTKFFNTEYDDDWILIKWKLNGRAKSKKKKKSKN